MLIGLEREGQGVRDKNLDKGIEVLSEAEAEAEGEAEEEEDLLEAGAVEYVSDFEESDEELADMEDWSGREDDEDEAEVQKKIKLGDKRKRTRPARVTARKKQERVVERETATVAAQALAW